ncbi:hypothetical protein PIB30_041602 [Stylosanthes scabra]|uniref:Uncharacterized protein n=1 Tax=Stylosanthes scabra TaxID=79078 RepID=A0ABU6VEK5_9FABA|nr:hypothetical protein [Stylosanthes scabra]
MAAAASSDSPPLLSLSSSPYSSTLSLTKPLRVSPSRIKGGTIRVLSNRRTELLPRGGRFILMVEIIARDEDPFPRWGARLGPLRKIPTHITPTEKFGIHCSPAHASLSSPPGALCGARRAHVIRGSLSSYVRMQQFEEELDREPTLYVSSSSHAVRELWRPKKQFEAATPRHTWELNYQILEQFNSILIQDLLGINYINQGHNWKIQEKID